MKNSKRRLKRKFKIFVYSLMRSFGTVRFYIVIKSLFFRLFSDTATFFIVFLFTKDIMISFFIAAVSFLVQVLLYYTFDVKWTKLFRGRSK